METKHVLTLAMFATASATSLGSLSTWAEVFRPGVVAGLLGQLGAIIIATYTQPPKPRV